VLRYFIRRLLWACVLFIAVTLVTFVIFFVVPADPARQVCGQRATAECVVRARHFLGLDQPMIVQYGRFLDRLVVHQSLGRSFTNRQDVTRQVLNAAPVTASLVFGGAVVWLLVAIPAGILSALRPRSLLDRVTMVGVLVGISAHPVWIGLLGAYFLGFRLQLVLITGYCDFFAPTGDCGGPTQWAYHLLLPWCCFAVLHAATYVRMIRAYTIETLNEDHVRTARAKGAPEALVLRRHVIRNSLLPVVTILGMDLGLALGGAFFTETVFGLPGLGRLAVGAIDNFDLPTVQGVVVFATVCVLLFSLLIDTLYAWIDPRIRLT
jgi:peptide/nickel transport system permease protein